jgi:hypothetical protein
MKKGFWVIGVCLLGCSSQDATGGSGTDASTDMTADATVDATADAAADAAEGGLTECNALSNVGTVIQQMYVSTDGVVGDGGALAAGTYVLTAAAVYTGPDGGTGPTGTALADTVALAGGGGYERVVSIINDAGLDGSPIHQNGSFTLFDGGGIQVNQSCPAGAQPFTSYDSDGTTLRIFAPAAGPNPAVMFEYTKQ